MDVEYKEALFECGVCLLLDENGEIVKTFDRVPEEVIHSLLLSADKEKDRLKEEKGLSIKSMQTIADKLLFAVDCLLENCFGEDAKVCPFSKNAETENIEAKEDVFHALNYIEKNIQGARETIDELFTSGKDIDRKNCEYTLARVISLSLREKTLAALVETEDGETWHECKGRWEWK